MLFSLIASIWDSQTSQNSQIYTVNLVTKTGKGHLYNFKKMFQLQVNSIEGLSSDDLRK